MYQTAEIIAKPHNLPVQTHPGLMERGLGSLEGRRREPGEALPGDIESSDAYVFPLKSPYIDPLSPCVTLRHVADNIDSGNV